MIGNVDVGGVFGVFTSSSGNVASFQSNGAVNGDIIIAINGTSFTGTVSAVKASLSASTDLRFTAQQNGAGDATFEALVLGAGDARSLYQINGGQAWSVGLDNSDSDKFKIAGSAALGTTDRLTIDSSGNVGIGATTPGTRLTVSGGYISQTDGTVTTFLGSDGTGSLFGTTTNQYLRFITNDTERMRITAGGTLLLGTATVPTSATTGVLAFGAVGTAPSAVSDGGALYVDSGGILKYRNSTGLYTVTIT